MKDTHPAVEALWRKKWMERSPEERFLAGCRMYDTAKIIVQSGIRHENPGISEADLRRAVFRRFYGDEVYYPFPAPEKRAA